MFSWIRDLILGNQAKTADQILRYPNGKRYYCDFHTIRKHMIDQDAVKVITRLQQFNYKAYIVGGSVRDLLQGRIPKDYDIVTNARPNEIKKKFTNSRLIGRRFRIVHIFFRGNKIIEVSTSRSLPPSRENAKNENDLYLKKDNMYGSFKEDAARRDFTINSLFFDVHNETILDYTGGYNDLKSGLIRTIGNENISLPEDPVRMLRAIKYCALLNFKLHPRLNKGIRKYRKLIKKATIARMHEEYNKIFRTGQSFKVFELMNETGLLEAMFPKIYPSWEIDNFGDSLLGKRLKIGDSMIKEHEDINTTIYYSMLLSDFVLSSITKDKTRGHLNKAKEALQNVDKEFGLSKKESSRIASIFSAQSVFGRQVNERRGWVQEFKNKEYYTESFTLYKINSRARKDDQAIQKALFWEIGLRKKVPNAIQKTKIKNFNHSKNSNLLNIKNKRSNKKGRFKEVQKN